jgi:hypothetical protein
VVHEKPERVITEIAGFLQPQAVRPPQ